MHQILHINASPRNDGYSASAATSFISELSARDPRVDVDRLDLWDAALPELNGDTIAAKYARLAGNAFSARQVAAWQAVEESVRRFDRADRIVISTPLWNFGIPYKLKHLIDVITQPGLSFSFAPDVGYRALLRDRPAVVILSSAGDYRHGPSRGRPDLATPYLREALAFIGIRDLTFVPVGPTAGPADALTESKARAERELSKLAHLWAEKPEGWAA